MIHDRREVKISEKQKGVVTAEVEMTVAVSTGTCSFPIGKVQALPHRDLEFSHQQPIERFDDLKYCGCTQYFFSYLLTVNFCCQGFSGPAWSTVNS